MEPGAPATDGDDEPAVVRSRLAVLQDPGNPSLVLVSFEDAEGWWYRQHWRRDGAGRWRIAAERRPVAPRRR
jgi:hypothetical protein